MNKSTKLLSGISSGLTYGGSVRYAEEQSLTTSQQDTALSNIGLDFVHVDYSLFNTTLSDADFNRLWNARGLIVDGKNETTIVLVRGRSTSAQVTFLSIRDATTMFFAALLSSTKKLDRLASWPLTNGAVLYDTSQNLTDARKQQARSNMGVQSADELLEDADFIAQLKVKLGIE